MIRSMLVIFSGVCAIVVALTPEGARALETAVPTSPTQSQSGYPDVRKEAADSTLFPNPDEVARSAVRTARATGNDNGGGRRNIRGRRVGTRSNDLLLGSVDADPLPVRISYRRAKTLAMERDPNLRTLLLRADLADTDVEKRRYLHNYYSELFADVRKIDSTPVMKAHLALLGRYVEQRYDPKRRAVAGEDDLINGRDETHQIRTR